MPAYQVAYHPTQRIAYIQADNAALPSGCVDIGSYNHQDTEPAITDLEFDVNHVHVQHVRDLLYKRKASNPAQTAKFPENITDVHNVKILWDITAIAGGADFSIKIGETKQLKPAVTPASAQEQKLNYSSATPARATVDSNGLVTGVSAGTSVLTISSPDGASDTVTVTVTA